MAGLKILLSYIKVLWQFLLIPRNWLFCVLNGIGYHTSWRFYGLPFIQTYFYRGKIEIQEGFVARSAVESNSIGVFQKVILKSEPGALIRIGSNVGISGSTISASTEIIIGNNVLIGSGCLITDSDAHPIDPIARIQNIPNATKQSPIEIEDDVFIGARSIILKGVRIGKGSIVGAGSVVSADVPPNCIVAGNPARMIRIINLN